MSKRILVAINRFGNGGAERLMVDLLNNLDKDKNKVYAIAILPDNKKNVLENTISDIVPVYKADFKNLYDLSAYLRLYKILKNIQPEVVISNLFFSNTVLRFVKIFSNYKIVCVEHSNYVNRKPIHRFINRLLDVVTDKYVAVSEGVADFFITQTQIDKRKVVVIKNGIDFNWAVRQGEKKQKKEIRGQLNVAKQINLFISVGRAVSQKNQLILVKAFEIFHKENRDTHLLIIGDGPELPKIKDYVDKNKINFICLLGYQQNVHPYLHASDYFISSSTIEGFGLAILEAYAHTLPVISTPTIGGKLLVKDGVNGLLADDFTEESIVNVLRKTHTYNFNINKEKNLLIEEYDIKNMVSRYQELVKNM